MELSIEEKAKRYDEALKEAKKWHKTFVCGQSYPAIDIKVSYEWIFPELKESEDEGHRKWILEYLYDGLRKSDEQFKSQFKCAIAWLEKQGKEEYALKSFKDEDVRKFMQYIEKQAKAYEFNLPNRGYDIYAFAKDLLVWLEEQGEQKPYGQRKECTDCQFNYAGECKGFCAMKRSEQKPAWSEEDELIIKRIDSLLYSINESEFEDIHAWLKFLKDRVQPKQEWSEEDITKLKSAITLLQNPLIACDEVNDGIRIKIVNWLKSIEGKVLLQSKQEWKPSDEQMNLLEELIEDNNQRHFYTILRSLYEQLKKLREE